MRAVVLFLTIISVSYGSEWITSRLQHCVERCTLREKLGRTAYVCYTSDGLNKEFRPSNRTAGTSGRPSYDHPIPSLDDDSYPWDFCTPAKIDKLEPDESEEEEDDDYNLRPDNADDNQGGFHGGSNRNDESSGGSGFNPGSKVRESVLESGVCSSACKLDQDEKAYKCTHEGSSENFYCSPDLPLLREQITSVNKLWCIGKCEMDRTRGENTCRTLLGKDICSEMKGFSVKGTKCLSECAVWEESFHNYLSCKIEEGIYEQCGNWNVEGLETRTLEYTHEEKVCAGPCHEHDGSSLCPYAEWMEEGSEDDPKAVLYMKEGYCGPESGANWTLIGIILGAVVGAIILIAGIGFFLSKRSGYNRAATSGV